MRLKLFALFIFAFILLSQTGGVLAQSNPSDFEVGAQFSMIRFSDLDTTEPGFGGRLTYNVNKHVAVEAEVNLFPRDPQGFLENYRGGHKTQALFGVKAGKRFERFGLFGKVRPGFVSFSHLVRRVDCCPFPPPPFNFSETNFALDVGAVGEIYTSPRTFLRVDVGDTIIRSGSGIRIDLPGRTNLIPLRIVTRDTSHNLQMNVGVGFRLSKETKGQTDQTSPPRRRAPRYEVGVHFTSLTVTPHSPICFDLCLIGAKRTYTEPGFGGRFTFNVTDNIGLEAEGNIFPRDHRDVNLLGLAGRMTQGQFGAKMGKRFTRVGVFGKIRPGFVSFSKVSYLVSSRTITFMGSQFEVGEFGVRKEKFFSTDVGGVVELYPSRHVIARIDVGDTIIRYGEIEALGSSLSNAIQRIAPETRHNFQFTAGVGFRFW